MTTALIIPTEEMTPQLARMLAGFRSDGSIRPVAVFFGGASAGEIPGAVVLRCAGGKGAAIKAGLEYVRDHMPECRYVIKAEAVQDAGSRDVMRIFRALCKGGGAQLVMGKRAINPARPVTGRLRSWFIRSIFAIAAGTNIHDVQTPIKGFGRELIDVFLNIDGQGLEYEVNLLLYAARRGIPIREVDVPGLHTESGHTYLQHLIKWIKVYACVVTFAVSSLIAFLLDFFILLGLNRLLSGINEIVALVISVGAGRIISSIVNFYMNHFIVFDSNEPVGTALLKYSALAAFIMVGNYAVMHVLNILMNMPLGISKVIADTALFVVSFIVQGKFIYNKKDS